MLGLFKRVTGRRQAMLIEKTCLALALFGVIAGDLVWAQSRPTGSRPFLARPAGGVERVAAPTTSPAAVGPAVASPAAGAAVETGAGRRPVRLSPTDARQEPWLVPDDAATAWAGETRLPPRSAELPELTAAEQQQFGRALATALQLVIPADRAPTDAEVERAGEAFRQAQALSANDPRWHQASGLWALSRGDWMAADRAFSQAIAHSQGTHHLAWAGRVYAVLSAGDRQGALEICREFAEALASPSAEWADRDWSEGSAGWLGRAVATVVTPGHRPGIEAVRQRLPEPLWPQFDAGVEAVSTRRAILLEWSRLSVSQLHAATSPIRTALGDRFDELWDRERELVLTRHRLKKEQAAAIREKSTPLVQQARQLQSEGVAARQALRAWSELAADPAALSPGSPAFVAVEGGQLDGSARLAHLGATPPLGQGLPPQERRAEMIHQMRDQQWSAFQLRRERMLGLEQELQAGRDQRISMERNHAGRLTELEQELSSTRQIKLGVTARLKDLRQAVAKPSSLRERAAAPAIWLPLNLTVQRDNLIAGLSHSD